MREDFLGVDADAVSDAIRSHEVVTLDGVGSRYSGQWYVAGVTHRLDGVHHTMDLDLVRNALEA